MYDTARTKFEKKYNLGISHRLGVLLDECWALYGKIGAVYGQFKDTFTYTTAQRINDEFTGTTSKQQHLWGVDLGAGLSFAYGSHWSTSLEYSYQIYQRFRYAYDLTAGYNKVIRISPRYHRILLTLSYKI